MGKDSGSTAAKAVDSIQEKLTDYACALTYERLSPEAIHAAKIRIIDTLGVLVCGFFMEPCRIARTLAAAVPTDDGATIIGTRMKTLPDIAAFVNGTTQRYVELGDSYHWPGAYGGHPSDVVTPVMATAEYVHASGRDLITAMVLAYEVHLRIDDLFHNTGFDHTIFACLATAVASSKLMGLTREQMSHAISMAIVPNNSLRQARSGHRTMWKVAATGQAGRSGVFAAQLAKAGMEGPHLPFEGKSGWLDHVARERFTLTDMGGNGTHFKILDTGVKLRPTSGLLISPVLATEKIAPVHLGTIKSVKVEVYKRGMTDMGPHQWNPTTPQSATRSIPYVIAAALRDGTVTLRTFTEAAIANPEIRTAMAKIEVCENEEFTQAYGRVPVEHRARITVTTTDGKTLIGEAGGAEDLSGPKSDEQINDKFKGLCEDVLGAARVQAILNRLWSLEKLDDAAVIPQDFVFI
jgi:2-methylcitrate dehydratase